ncbi:putative bifunctional diguanylate cyclase/phosphodiesterase [Devosia salina]|uniref:EAL domain-containing protein n=1 Tax=Devosia salina TaxID=2860336 RepID=A0ABX8WDC4_9HYPH|nr:EAL domain-containing protein [Devosia salina]QYO76768.1 EAL domain-containing protein [Devosia salina]
MPALDYVSIVRSVYGDRMAMLGGVFATAITSGLAAYSNQSVPLYVITVTFLVIGFVRDANMRAFRRAAIADDDISGAEHWETRAVWTGGALALTYGLWCLISMGFVQDPFAELSSASITIAVTVGIVARNFGLDRLVTIQVSLVIIPLSIGYVMLGDLNHIVLAAMLAVMLISFRKLAGDIRAILLAAVHGREEASRLAAELDIAITTLEHGLCMLDENGVVTVANERANGVFAMLGIGQLANQPFGSVLAALGTTDRVPRTAVEQLASMIARRASGKVLLSLSPGRYYEVTVSSRDKRSVLLFEDISERVEAQERISFMARHDTLTNLPNRSHFGELALEELETRAATDSPSALMIFDIDEFKHVNDSFGHVVGDKLLRQAANRLRETLPKGTTLARLGGDEFIALSGNDPERARADAQSVLDAFQEPFVLDGHQLSAQVSIGVVTSPASQDELDELMTKADLALYAAKGEGKGRSQFFHAQMDIDYHYRQRLKTDLRDAVAADALTLVFQPLLDIDSRRVVSCEALARWTHPELGAIAPTTFIPLAEEMGIISQITDFVVRSAVAQCSQWSGDIGVAVNVSARDFRGLDLPSLVDRALREADLAPSRLELEVTETAVIEERELAQSVLQSLSARGISIALDDFGTGYSSLSYLSALPFSKLKIDRSFVQDIAGDERALSLLANVARLGRDLDLTVVAEGVETEEQLNAMLEHTGIQQVQGYLFSRPLPARDIAELIGRLNGKASLASTKRKHG